MFCLVLKCLHKCWAYRGLDKVICTKNRHESKHLKINIQTMLQVNKYLYDKTRLLNHFDVNNFSNKKYLIISQILHCLIDVLSPVTASQLIMHLSIGETNKN